MQHSVWIGWEPREAAAFAVARHSARQNLGPNPLPIRGLVLARLQRRGLYTRPISRRGNQMWDDISDAPMSTEFACSRFLVPHLVRTESKHEAGNRWAVFMDCDMLVRGDLTELFRICERNPDKAVMVVQHDHRPNNAVKMDGQAQTRYARKNWSSVCAFNVDHPANDKLTPELVNSIPGRDLHAFMWLRDNEIGELGTEWNYLVGHSDYTEDPKIVHFTDGIPHMPGFEDCEFSDEWANVLETWAK